MAEPTDRRSMRSRKPIVHFDDKIAQSLAPKKSTKSTKPVKSTKSTKNPKESAALPTLACPTEPIALEDDDIIEELCNQAEELDIEDDPKAKKRQKQLK